jgi:hypothetical protein
VSRRDKDHIPSSSLSRDLQISKICDLYGKICDFKKENKQIHEYVICIYVLLLTNLMYINLFVFLLF